MTPKTECVEVLVQHFLPVRVQHRDVNISHLQTKKGCTLTITLFLALYLHINDVAI